MRLSDKQAEFWTEPYHRWCVKSGATRSGKTWLDYYIIPKRIRECAGRDGLIVLIGNTRGTLQRNIIEPMQELYGTGLVSSIRYDNTAQLFGAHVHCLGADTKKHVNRLRGTSIQYCYGDEVVTWAEDVFTMLKSRLDKPYSRFDGTCNPGGPNHWFYKFLQSDADIYLQNYTLDDNPFLAPSVRDAIKREHAGTVFYDRYVLGRWVAAEGAIYPMFAAHKHVSDKPPAMRMEWIAADIGHTNPTAFLRLGVGQDGLLWVLDEYYDDGKVTGAKSPRRYADDMVRFASQSTRKPDCVVVDPAAEGFILQLREQAPSLRIRHAHNAVLEGIQLVASAFDAGLIRIHPRCKCLIDELHGYAWDPNAQERGEDKPIKQNDHACDALRYGMMEYERDITRRIMSIGSK